MKIKIYVKVVLCILWVTTCQSQEKRQLIRDEYNLWHKLTMGVSSEDGVWISYSKLYHENKDTLFLKNTATDKEYFFKNGINEKITKNGDMFTFMSLGSLYMLDTKTGKQKEYLNVNSYDFTENGNNLIYQSGSTLNFETIKSGEFIQLDGVKEYSICPNQEHVVVVQKNEKGHAIKLIKLKDLTIKEISSSPETFEYQQLVWNATGNTIGYYIFDNDNKTYTIGSISLGGSIKESTLSWSAVDTISEDVQIIKSKLYVSDKGDKVFFDTQEKNVLNYDNGKVRVWNSTDKEIPPQTNLKYKIWNVWLPSKGKVLEIEQNNLMVCALIDKQNKAVLLDNDVYLPLYEYGDRYSDVYLMDLETGITEKIIEKQLRLRQHLITEPNGQYIAYFKNEHWWSYDIVKRTHQCLTDAISQPFNKYDSDRLDTHHAFGFGGWTTNGELMVYDEYDIWKLACNGKKSEKLTNGRDKNEINRIYKYIKGSIRDDFYGYIADTYNLNDGVLIHTLNRDKLSEGFGLLDKKGGFRKIVHDDFKIQYIKRIGKDKFQYSAMKFDVSPYNVFVDGDGSQKIICRSNLQQNEFHWGKSELIYYQSPEGKQLKGALFFPANYDPNKKYPMVVSIYENLSMMLHEYVTPTMNNPSGFNVTNFTQEGYFVLEPDISYTINQTGQSALNCVLSAVNQAIKLHSIDESKLGLIGHSFGGFETSYIVSQTDKFKAAIAGAGVNDLLSFYLDIDSSNLSNMERFESEQLRNQIPFTDLEFIKESPIMNVKTINTPLLIWSGLNDRNVPPTYSIKLFAALWRLKKECKLLLYPNEPHVLINSENQIDITSKTMDWFNYYLKEN